MAELTAKQKEVRAVFATAARYILVYGGSRSGKTFFTIYAIIVRMLKAPGSRHVVFRNDGVDAKNAIARDTVPAVLALFFPGLTLKWREQDGYFQAPNGSELWLAGLKDRERLDKALGREYATIYLNEASQITLEAMRLVVTRLAQTVNDVNGRALAQKMYVDLNPTVVAHWTYQIFVAGVNPEDSSPIKGHSEKYAHIIVNPADNAENLDPEYLESLADSPERQRKRFYEGLFTADDDNALWRRSYIKYDSAPPVLERVVIAVDPAITNDAGSDETGLIAIGKGADGRGYVLADESGKYRPEEWARRAVSMFDTYDADAIVAEVNQGGDMVESTVLAQVISRQAKPPIRKVVATKNKQVRAEPVAALYERGNARHVHPMPELEDQMCSFTLGFDRKQAGYSPDRVDALVWGFTDLFGLITRHKKAQAPVQVPTMVIPGAGGRW